MYPSGMTGLPTGYLFLMNIQLSELV
jgi:hypothetical protein